MIKAIILDDEIKGSNLMQHKLKAFSEQVEVLQVFNDPQEALGKVKALAADVLFLDVEMPVLNGFQFLEKLEQFDFEVIFVTAYNIYTLDALRANALDYLLKPVNPDELHKAIIKLEKRMEGKEKLKHLEPQPQRPCSSRIALPTAEGIHLIKREDILRIEAMSNYSVFYLLNQPKIIVSKTLKEYELLLEETNFLRINRSTIVNLDFVVKYKKGDGGQVEMLDGAELEVSSAKKSLLMERLFS